MPETDNKFFKVKEIVNRNGDKSFVVFGAASRFAVILGIWDEYKKQNTSLDDAICQIKAIYRLGTVSEKDVFATNVNKISAEHE